MGVDHVTFWWFICSFLHIKDFLLFFIISLNQEIVPVRIFSILAVIKCNTIFPVQEEVSARAKSFSVSQKRTGMTHHSLMEWSYSANPWGGCCLPSSRSPGSLCLSSPIWTPTDTTVPASASMKQFPSPPLNWMKRKTLLTFVISTLWDSTTHPSPPVLTTV